MKTISLKKVSAVAVASLGFGLLSVVPATAVSGAYTVTATAVAVGTKTGATTAPYSAGDTLVQNITVGTAAVTAADEIVSFSTAVTAGPVGTEKDITSTCTFTATQTTQGAGVGAGSSTNSVTSAGVWTVDPTIAGATAAATLAIGSVSCPTTIGGVYQIAFTELTAPVKVGFGAKTDAMLPTAAGVNVSGINVFQGTTRNTTAGTAPVSGQASVRLVAPQHAAAATPFTFRTSGVGSIYGVGTIVGGGAVKAVNGSTTDFSTGVVLTTAADTVLASVPVTLTSSVAGVQNITVTSVDATSGVATTIYTGSITWGSAPASSATLSLVTLLAGATNTAATGAAADTTATAVSKSLATQAFTIPVAIRDQNNVALIGQGLAVSVTGPGTLGLLDNANNATAKGGRSLSITTMAGSAASVAVWADGTAGTSTITITSGTTVLAVKTVTFFGSVAKLTATQNLTTAVASSTGAKLGYDGTANSTTNVPAVLVVATDKDGFVVPGLAASITGVSSDTTVIGNGVVVEDATGTLALNSAGTYNAAVTSAVNGTSGKSATMTYRIVDPAGDGTTYITSSPVTFKLGKAVVAKATWTFDKASYSAGSPMVLTLTATDSAGNPVADGLYTGLWTAAPVTSAVISSAPTADPVFTGGVKTYKSYAPSIGGPVTVTSTFGVAANTATATAGTSVTGSTTVADGNAALLTQIDALNAKIVALNALIAKIMKKLGVK